MFMSPRHVGTHSIVDVFADYSSTLSLTTHISADWHFVCAGRARSREFNARKDVVYFFLSFLEDSTSRSNEAHTTWSSQFFSLNPETSPLPIIRLRLNPSQSNALKIKYFFTTYRYWIRAGAEKLSEEAKRSRKLDSLAHTRWLLKIIALARFFFLFNGINDKGFNSLQWCAEDNKICFFFFIFISYEIDETSAR